MKVSLIVLSLACFVGALHALPIQEESEPDEIGTFLGVKPQIFPNVEEEEVQGIEPTRRPKPPQIHDNAYKSQGPLSGRLTNIVLNRKGVQTTIQRNRIEYNLNAAKQALENLLENEQHREKTPSL